MVLIPAGIRPFVPAPGPPPVPSPQVGAPQSSPGPGPGISPQLPAQQLQLANDRASLTSAMHALAPNEDRRTPGERRLQERMPRLVQGDTNGCGTTCLAMGLTYLGIPADRVSIDNSVRASSPGKGLGSAPSDLVAYARRAGVQAEVYNEGDFASMAGHVEAGRPVMVVINPPEGGLAHYVQVVGIIRDESGRPTGVKIRDPRDGRDKIMTLEQFDAAWRNTRLSMDPDGFVGTVGMAMPAMNRCYIVMDSASAPRLPRPSIYGEIRGAPADLALHGLNGYSGAIGTIGRGHVAAGILQFGGATVATAIGGASYFVGNFIGRNVEQGGDALLSACCKLWRGNALEKLGAILLAIVGAILKAVGWVLSMVGGTLAVVGKIAARPFELLAEHQNKADEARERQQAQAQPADALRRLSIPLPQPPHSSKSS